MPKKNVRIDPDLCRMLAEHEAGHATIALALGKMVKRAEINSDDCSGCVSYWPSRTTAVASFNTLVVSAGGVVAERLARGEHDEGCTEDIRMLTLGAVRYIDHFGLAGQCPIHYSALSENTGLRHEERSRQVFEAVEQLIRDAYRQAEEILRREDALFKAVTERLFLKRSLGTVELGALRDTYATAAVVRTKQ